MHNGFHANDPAAYVSASTAPALASISADGADPQTLIGNMSAAWAFVTFGSSTVTATFPTTGAASNGYFCAPGSVLLATPGTKATYASVVLSAGAGGVLLVSGSQQ